MCFAFAKGNCRYSPCKYSHDVSSNRQRRGAANSAGTINDEKWKSKEINRVRAHREKGINNANKVLYDKLPYVIEQGIMVLRATDENVLGVDGWLSNPFSLSSTGQFQGTPTCHHLVGKWLFDEEEQSVLNTLIPVIGRFGDSVSSGILSAELINYKSMGLLYQKIQSNKTVYANDLLRLIKNDVEVDPGDEPFGLLDRDSYQAIITDWFADYKNAREVLKEVSYDFVLKGIFNDRGASNFRDGTDIESPGEYKFLRHSLTLFGKDALELVDLVPEFCIRHVNQSFSPDHVILYKPVKDDRTVVFLGERQYLALTPSVRETITSFISVVCLYLKILKSKFKVKTRLMRLGHTRMDSAFPPAQVISDAFKSMNRLGGMPLSCLCLPGKKTRMEREEVSENVFLIAQNIIDFDKKRNNSGKSFKLPVYSDRSHKMVLSDGLDVKDMELVGASIDTSSTSCNVLTYAQSYDEPDDNEVADSLTRLSSTYTDAFD
jgi:hypothetical protein